MKFLHTFVKIAHLPFQKLNFQGHVFAKLSATKRATFLGRITRIACTERMIITRGEDPSQWIDDRA